MFLLEVCSPKPDGQKEGGGQKCQEKVKIGWKSGWFGIPLPFCIKHAHKPHTHTNKLTQAQVLSQDHESSRWLGTNINMVQTFPTCGTELPCFFLPTFFFCEKSDVWRWSLPIPSPFSSSVVAELLRCSDRGSLQGSGGPSLEWIISSGSFY